MKRVLLFGSTGSIGSFLKNKLSECGYEVITSSRKNSDIDYDFFNPSETRAFEKIKNLDAVIFAQGINPSISFEDINEEHFLRMFQLNVIGPTYILKSIKPFLNKNASIIFFSSIASKKGSYDPAYASAKSSLNGLMNTLTNKLNNQRVNILSLGLVEGSRVEKQMTDDFKENHKKKMFQGNLIKVENIASLVIHLIENNNINNSEINLDGGFKN